MYGNLNGETLFQLQTDPNDGEEQKALQNHQAIQVKCDQSARFVYELGIDHATYGAYKIFHPCVPTSEFDTSRANNTQFQAKSKDR